MARYKQLPLPPEQMMLFSTSVEDSLPEGSSLSGLSTSVAVGPTGSMPPTIARAAHSTASASRPPVGAGGST